MAAEAWAQKCAKLEKGSAGFLLDATQEYAAKVADGWSRKQIATEVTAAGYPISEDTIGYRLKALEQLEASGSRSATAFAMAYSSVLRDNRGPTKGHPAGILPKNEQGLADVMVRAAERLQKDYDYDAGELASFIKQQTTPKTQVSVEKPVKQTRIDRNYDLLDEVLQLLDELEPPLSKRAQTKYDQVVLKLQVIGEEATV